MFTVLPVWREPSPWGFPSSVLIHILNDTHVQKKRCMIQKGNKYYSSFPGKSFQALNSLTGQNKKEI